MIKKEYYKACDIDLTSTLDKRKKEYFNEYGYNLSSSRKNNTHHFKQYSCISQKDVKNKPKS